MMIPYMRCMKYVRLMFNVKCMCCVLLSMMCLVEDDFIVTLDVNSIMRCYLHIELVLLGVVLGDGSYVQIKFHDILCPYEYIWLD